ncbi:HAD family hydrolase [Rugosimonospora africana]|uniref:Haloacid dehalogenase n=1 Tax=Rugosimonospora africana TaxID=556532 RepID=A0A8J3QZR2_9ACTN|nr:HAD family hydrolase [Rugosimonospora africana]GIH19893.1 haloacid dehalogenase [Rugosimonospora africana]
MGTVLFDVDGTLVDTTYLHAVTWWQALAAHGRPVPMARIHRAVGMGSDRLLPYLLGEEPDEELSGALTAAHASLYQPYWPQLQPLPGAGDPLRACAARGLGVVLASSASADELTALRKVLAADDVITTATSAADASTSKPAPDILQVALERSGTAASDAVFLGDSVWDVEAAGRAGVPCLAVECGGTSRAELQEAGAIAVYRDPAALCRELERGAVLPQSLGEQR